MSNLKNILQSFQLKDELNPKIWEKTKNDEYTMRSKVRTHLLEIAYDFIDSLGVDIIVSDIIMTGSLANYNWSNFSDVDLHILIDFEEINKNHKKDSVGLHAIIKEFFDAKMKFLSMPK